MEINNLIEEFLSVITCLYLKSSEVIYWSYSQKKDTNLSELNKARREFSEVIRRGSEPGIRFFNEGEITKN